MPDPILSAGRRFVTGGFSTLRSVVEAVPAWGPALLGRRLVLSPATDQPPEA